MEVTAHEKLSYVFDRATLGSQVAYINEARRIAAPKSYYARLSYTCNSRPANQTCEL
jgi:hypothetical protein